MIKGSSQFNGDLLLLGRNLRQLTQEKLIADMNNEVAQGTLSKIEHGLVEPTQEQVMSIAKVLRLHPNFFYNHVPLYDFTYSFYRTQKSISISSHKVIQARANLYRMHIRKFLDSIEFEPELEEIYKIDCEGKDPFEVAAITRHVWNVPCGGVHNITYMIERAGIIVIPMDFGTMKMDGFCHASYDGIPPLIFINKNLSVDRYRFSLMHELGHLLMHRVPTEDQENEANVFAASFLMPDEEIKRDFSVRLSLQRFADLKRKWGVSMQALIYKAWSLGKLTDRGLKYYQIEMSKRGYRKNEPVQLDNFKENPSSLNQLIQVHLDQLGYSMEELCEVTNMYEDELRVMYGLREKPKVHLRLVS
ncbi:XRE family transcriptional regulator [Commensalibacter nepenthis]|uniref:XRE family transcriptional regulator n=1 Tax=Commensalibacter nepenthis TaxID=3043872 RepID=A0ABT6Q4H1_9PROT|nr:XRE family transcriptional regulator [Commensalibacter sp. TBRC 10068]MDI2111797.1 XRE family transcriptional regulator [Commensalibacter sp. TBRC 10068]